MATSQANCTQLQELFGKLKASHWAELQAHFLVQPSGHCRWEKVRKAHERAV